MNETEAETSSSTLTVLKSMQPVSNTNLLLYVCGLQVQAKITLMTSSVLRLKKLDFWKVKGGMSPK